MVAHPSARAKQERQQTLSLRRDYKFRQHMVAMEKAAEDAVKDAPEPPPVPRGSSGMTTIINVPVRTIVGGGMPIGGMSPMQQGTGIPARAGLLPLYWEAAYAPLLQRFAQSTW